MNLTLQEKLAAFNPELPLAEASTVPPLWYFDEEIASYETRQVFSRHWILAGRREQVREPGSYLTFEVAGESVTIARDKEGQLAAFSNVCRHRGARILTAACGKASSLQCRYHGWTYDLGGNLKATPSFDGVKHFPKEENGLPRFQLAEWGPFLFVNLDTNAVPFHKVFAPLIERTASVPYEKYQFVKQTVYDLNCNWKVFVDNYLDGGYHVKTLHRGLASVIDDSKYRTEVMDWTSLQSTPLAPGPNADVAAVRKGSLAQYWWAFPNFMVNIYDGVMDTNLVLPLGPNRCRVLFDYYFTETEGQEAQDFIEQSIAVAHQVQLEDEEISESVQRGIQSRTYHAGRFSVQREAAGYHFHQLLAKELRRQ